MAILNDYTQDGHSIYESYISSMIIHYISPVSLEKRDCINITHINQIIEQTKNHKFV